MDTQDVLTPPASHLGYDFSIYMASYMSLNCIYVNVQHGIQSDSM